jgi:ABC-type transport system involved in cytochrome c biogenesis ATPase subunit/GNAT superfamily N-acetyltransferase
VVGEGSGRVSFGFEAAWEPVSSDSQRLHRAQCSETEEERGETRMMSEVELKIPIAELVDVELLKVDGENPNLMSPRRFEALRKSISRYGFAVPIITNKDLVIADGEHRLQAAKALGFKQVSVVQLPVDEVDRRLIRQVMNKLRGEHDLFLDAEEYYRIVCGDKRDLLKALLNETDVRIDNLLKLREPTVYSDDDLKALAEKFSSRVESNKLEGVGERQRSGESLTLKCHVEFSTKAEITERTLAVCEAFGLGVDEAKRFVVFDDFSLDFHRGDLIYVTGDSGGGKTLLLKAFKNFFGDEAVELSDLQVDPEETLIEGIGADVKEAIEILSLCGLGDAFLFLRKYGELSDGQKWRYRLAKLVNNREKNVWLIDEFCACLDRVMARIVAFLVQKVARKLGKTVIVATAHGDLVKDFRPDLLIEKGFEQDISVTKPSSEHGSCSVCRNVRIEQGTIEDYEKLKRFHYRSKNRNRAENPRLKDCFKLLYGEELIGVIVYSGSHLNLKPRNIVFGERYVYTPGDLSKARLINEEIARITRVVIHPKFRGIGLGELLVRETLPKVDAKVVEVLAVMARYNPFFERAGMVKVEYERCASPEATRIRELLKKRGFDFTLSKSKGYCRHFYSQLCEEDRKMLLRCLHDFGRLPFIKTKNVTPDMLGAVISFNGVYLYWMNVTHDSNGNCRSPAESGSPIDGERKAPCDSISN